MILKSDAIINWMELKGTGDLKGRYNKEMEVQVNVIPGGERITKTFKGKPFDKYSDGYVEWGPFRIPRNANADPEDNDGNLMWEFEDHLEAIGMTGWNWAQRHSEYVVFDFDSIINHSEGLNQQDLNKVIDTVEALEYVTVRRSTSGTGYHLEVHLDNVSTDNHTEHAALARAILGKMCSDTGYNFQEAVDCCGGNVWIWHTKQEGTNGFEITKEGNKLYDVPLNWRDHIDVVKGSRKKTRPTFVETDKEEDKLLALLQDKPILKLDAEHLELIAYLETAKSQAWWDADHKMLICHSYDLKNAHRDLGLQGVFETLSKGTDPEQNSFAFPLRNGGWSIRRYTQGIQEHELWTQDGRGWTKCYFNVPPDLESAAKSVGGVEDSKAHFKFREAAIAADAARILGADPNLPPTASTRDSVLYKTKEGKLVFRVERKESDDGSQFKGWNPEAKGKVWERIYNVNADRPVQPEVECHDDMIRHLISSERSVEMGWVINTQDRWVDEAKANCVDLLISQGIPLNKTRVVMGNCVKSPYLLVNKPFEEEYMGDRKWNRHSAQLRYKPREKYTSLSFPTWQKMLDHCGEGLDASIHEHEWCKQAGITSGADYLKCWVASIFQNPKEPLPYLFFHGPENSGKSSFHESIRMLMTEGYVRADHALANDAGYNAELTNAVLCVVEEIHLGMDKRAANRIKDWVTSDRMSIHEKRLTPVMLENCTHWIQCSNDRGSCPVNFGDTRIVFCYVQNLVDMIPRRDLDQRLLKEAPDFITELMNIVIPRPDDRLGLPVIQTQDKEQVSELMESTVARFLRLDTFDAPGYVISLADIYLRYKTVNPEAKETLRMFTSQVPASKYIKGRVTGGYGLGAPGVWSYGNVSLSEPEEDRRVLVLDGEQLV